jgi:predicted transcriptional regulator
LQNFSFQLPTYLGSVLEAFRRTKHGTVAKLIEFCNWLYLLTYYEQEAFVLVSTVNISFQNDFLVQIDQTANKEARTRSELISEAIRIYIERKNEWEKIFKTGEEIGATLEISENDIMNEIKEYRKTKI